MSKKPHVLTKKDLCQIYRAGVCPEVVLEFNDDGRVWTWTYPFAGFKSSCILVDDDHEIPFDNMNVTWRAWSSQPTKEEMKSAKWGA